MLTSKKALGILSSLALLVCFLTFIWSLGLAPGLAVRGYRVLTVLCTWLLLALDFILMSWAAYILGKFPNCTEHSWVVLLVLQAVGLGLLFELFFVVLRPY